MRWRRLDLVGGSGEIGIRVRGSWLLIPSFLCFGLFVLVVIEGGGSRKGIDTSVAGVYRVHPRAMN